MSRYISLYNSNADYALDASTMEFPHVSLIEGTGELKYISFKLKNLHDAPFGAIVVEDVANDKLTYIPQEDYNQTDYPTNSFKPFAVCIYDAASRNDNQAVFWVLPDRFPKQIQNPDNLVNTNSIHNYFKRDDFSDSADQTYLSGNHTTIEKNNYFRTYCVVDINISLDDLGSTLTSDISQYYYKGRVNTEKYGTISFAKNLYSKYIPKGSFYVPSADDFYKVVEDTDAKEFFKSNYVFNINNAYKLSNDCRRMILDFSNAPYCRGLTMTSNTITYNKPCYDVVPFAIFYAGPDFN